MRRVFPPGGDEAGDIQAVVDLIILVPGVLATVREPVVAVDGVSGAGAQVELQVVGAAHPELGLIVEISVDHVDAGVRGKNPIRVLEDDVGVKLQGCDLLRQRMLIRLYPVFIMQKWGCNVNVQWYYLDIQM